MAFLFKDQLSRPGGPDRPLENLPSVSGAQKEAGFAAQMIQQTREFGVLHYVRPYSLGQILSKES